MCAAVAVMPVTVIFAVTVWSGLMVTVPEPVAVVVTGGTSLVPTIVTVSAFVMPGIDAQAPTSATAAAKASCRACVRTISIFIVRLLDWVWAGRKAPPPDNITALCLPRGVGVCLTTRLRLGDDRG